MFKGSIHQTVRWDFTYVSTQAGMVYVAIVIDVLARNIVGWRVSTSMSAGFVLDALSQAICQRCPAEGSGLITNGAGENHTANRAA